MRLTTILILSLSLIVSNGFSVDYVVNKLKSVQSLLGSLSPNGARTHERHNQRPKRKIVSGHSSSIFKSSSQTEEGFLTDSRGRRLKTFTWRPSGAVKGLVFLSHGYAEHLVPGYSELAEVGKAQGFLVFGHDHVGHGQSEGERALVGDMEELTDPVIQHCREKVKENPGVPLFIIGHSLGGLITLLASLSPQMPRLSGMVLMGPLIKPDPKTASPFQQFMARVTSQVLPRLEIGGVDINVVTSDPVERRKLIGDQLRYHGGLKALMGNTMLDGMNSLEQNFSNVKSPYLIILGSEDKLSNIDGSKEFHKLSGSRDKTFRVIQNGFHNLYLERESIRQKTINETWSWIYRRI